MGVKVTIKNILTFKKFLNAPIELFLQVEKIDFQNITEYFPKTSEEIQAFKNVLLQCVALRAMSFTGCKLYEFNVDEFRVLGNLFLQCPNLELIDVKRTVHRFFLVEMSDNETRFHAFCEALAENSNLKILNFNENVFDKNINERCFEYFFSAIKRLKMLYNIQYGVNDFKLAHAMAIDNVLAEHRRIREQVYKRPAGEEKEHELDCVAAGVFFSANLQNKIGKQKKSFLNRQPEKVKLQNLYEGKFLLEESYRAHLKLEIEESIKTGERASFFNSLINDEKFLYFNQQHQVFVGSYKTSLGRGRFGEVFVIQNVLTGKWYCLKILKKGALNDSEVAVLAEEGLLLSSEKTPDEDLIISELVYGKSLKIIIQEYRKNRSLSFERALSMMISLVESYESLHRKNNAHRDIKPDNIIFDPEQQKCVAIDFGLVKKAGEASGWAGSFKYMPPEAFNLPFSSLQNDIYAMGMVIGEILAAVIGEHDLCHRQVVIKHYQQQALDMNPITKERYEYLKQTCKRIYEKEAEIDGFIRLYLEIFPVIFAAKSKKYQEQRELSAQTIELCDLIYQMTALLKERPCINAVLQKMRKIRLEHIENRRQHFLCCPDNRYNSLFNELHTKRSRLSNAPHALDDLDIFLLSAVDANEKNRPTIEKMERYLWELNNTLMLKKNLNDTLEAWYQKGLNNTQRKKTKRSRGVVVQEYSSTEKENTDPNLQNMTLNTSMCKEKPIVTQSLRLSELQLNKKRVRNESQKECKEKRPFLFVR